MMKRCQSCHMAKCDETGEHHSRCMVTRPAREDDFMSSSRHQVSKTSQHVVPGRYAFVIHVEQRLIGALVKAGWPLHINDYHRTSKKGRS
jgi:hypothetical protein